MHRFMSVFHLQGLADILGRDFDTLPISEQNRLTRFYDECPKYIEVSASGQHPKIGISVFFPQKKAQHALQNSVFCQH